MPYCIVETEDGWTIVEIRSGSDAKEVAGELGGAVIDPGPYDDYEDANDALLSMQEELAENGAASDVPGTRALEGRDSADGTGR